jgi:hypothetical protein
VQTSCADNGKALPESIAAPPTEVYKPGVPHQAKKCYHTDLPDKKRVLKRIYSSVERTLKKAWLRSGTPSLCMIAPEHGKMQAIVYPPESHCEILNSRNEYSISGALLDCLPLSELNECHPKRTKPAITLKDIIVEQVEAQTLQKRAVAAIARGTPCADLQEMYTHVLRLNPAIVEVLINNSLLLSSTHFD